MGRRRHARREAIEKHTMNMAMRSKVGLAALCAAWFQQVGLQGEGSEMAKTLADDYRRMVEFLGECFGQVVAPGIISTVSEAKRAAEFFRAEQVDALLLVHIMWSEDQPLLALLDGCQHLPILLWNYHPLGFLPDKLTVNDLFRCSGTVGMLQGSAPLQRLGLTFQLFTGAPGDPALRAILAQYDVALRLRREFRGLRAARVAGRCEVMTGTYVDEGTLQRSLGVTLVEISAHEYAEACAGVDGARVDAFYADQVARFPVLGVSEESLRLACRNTLALDDLVLRHNLGAVAIQDLDPELHRLAGIRPCLCPPISARCGVAYAMESDLNTALGLFAGMRASGGPGMYTEVFTFDPQANTLLMGHAGVHDPRLAAEDGVTLVPDLEYRNADRLEGVWQEFILASGPVTCISLYDTGQGYRLTAFGGVSLGAPRRLQGFAHALVRPEAPVAELLSRLVQRGMTQHLAVVPGRVEGVLGKWCCLSGIKFYGETCPEAKWGPTCFPAATL